MFDMSGSGQIMGGSLSTGGTTYLQAVQGTPNQILSKYGSSLVHQGHAQVDFERENAELISGSEPESLH